MALSWTGACDSSKEVFTPTGTLRVSVVDRSLVTQAAENPDPADVPGNQVVSWSLEVIEVDVAGLGLFDYKATTATCTQLQTTPATILPVTCGVVGFAFDPDVPLSVSLRLRISEMQVRRAALPALPPNADYDGDGVLNDTDNCVLIDNPGQQDVNNDGFGDACSLPNASGDPTIPDRDGDGVADGAPDNCLWIANTTQVETSEPKDGLGDACSLSADVDLGGPSVELELGPVDVVLREGSLLGVSAVFATSDNCDPGSMTTCPLGSVELLTP
jgi:hypothetical protein